MVAVRAEQPRQSENHSLFSPDLEWLLSVTEEQFREIFRKGPVKRTKWRGLLRNVCIALGNSGMKPTDPRYTEICARLSQLSDTGDDLLDEHSKWALDRLGFVAPAP